MLTLVKLGHRDLERYYPLLETDFDREALLGRLAVHRGMMNGAIEFLALRDEESGMDAGYALLLTKSLYGYVDLKYLAVMPWFRGRGFGVQLMREINRRYADAQGILAELSARDEADPARLRKLQRFFGRFGYEELACDCRVAGLRDRLFVKPLLGTTDLSPVIHRVLPDFYSRFLPERALQRMLEFQ